MNQQPHFPVEITTVNFIAKAAIKKPFSLSSLSLAFPFEFSFQLRRIPIYHNSVRFSIFTTGSVVSRAAQTTHELVLRERQRAAKVTVPYKLIWNTTPKLARIQSIEPYYSNGQLLFLDTWNRDYPELVEQLIHYPLAAHDDGPDALAGAISLILANEKARRQVLIPRAR
jgi:hypothetical protein